jgi:hypothetical protein
LVVPLVVLAGCGVVPDEANPVVIWRHATGASAADRPPPPNLDEPYPNLGTVPPRPDRPPAAVRATMSAALAAEREGSRQPLPPGQSPPSRGAAAAPGEPPVPAGPPPRAALATVPRVPAGQPPPPPPSTAPSSAGMPGAAPPPAAAPVTPARPAPAAREAPEVPPPAPAAPPPPPPSDMLGPLRGR